MLPYTTQYSDADRFSWHLCPAQSHAVRCHSARGEAFIYRPLPWARIHDKQTSRPDAPNTWVARHEVRVKRLRIGVIYGGRSGEHEVSLASAAAIFTHLDLERYEPVPIRIERDGHWVLPDRPPILESPAATIEQAKDKRRRITRSTREVHLLAHPGDETMLLIQRDPGLDASVDGANRAMVSTLALDMIFPIVHGPYGEDGTLQGLLELSNIPYVGAGVVASAAGMDKAVMKELFTASGLPIVKHEVISRRTLREDTAGVLTALSAGMTFPLFVKPANLGSSVGISQAVDRSTLSEALNLAAEFDRKIVIEEAVHPCREIECGVIGNEQPHASVPGEIVPAGDFYDYEAKYLNDRSEVVIPAALTNTQTEEIARLAVAAFRAIDGAGMARVDFLVSANTGEVFINEINTHPGFTTISMFSKLWAASGMSYSVLLDRLVELALERHTDKQERRTTPW